MKSFTPTNRKQTQLYFKCDSCLTLPSVSLGLSPGLAVGLDPEGYGNPDFCWLSMYDTLIWSFAGPIAIVVSVSPCISLNVCVTNNTRPMM